MGGDNDVATSPFTLVFKNAGLAFAASFMNSLNITYVLMHTSLNYQLIILRLK
jgi:lysine-specific permease